MMKKIKEFFAHPQIQIALAFGIGIIAQALVYKKIYHIEVEGIFILLPGFIVLIYEKIPQNQLLGYSHNNCQRHQPVDPSF